MVAEKDVTIIIPHLGGSNEEEYALDMCMDSLNESAPDMELLIAKNGDLYNCNHNRDVDVKKQGQCMAVNAAVATTNTKYIMVSNGDMIYPPSWWEKVSSWYGTLFHPETDTVSPILVEPRAGAPTFEVYFCGGAGGDFDKQKFFQYDKQRHEEYKAPPDGKKGTRSGFNLPFIISRELWDTIGGYDINYDPWGSNGDSDLEYKVKLAGGQSIQIVDWRVYHFSQTSGTFHPDNYAYWQKNFAYFKEKWGFDRTDDGIWEATFDIPKPPERIYTPEWEGKYKS
jgi:hypothetical protein